MTNKENIIENMRLHNKCLSKYACNDDDAIKLKKETPDIRTPFFRDIDKIIYTLSYSRYMDKTQVYSNIDNDMISKRIIHVQLVSKIARTLGRALNLNEDLIEAASLAHDLGHVPFGHVGEKILSTISEKNGEGYFNHNVQSVRILMNLENNGNGSNISLQVLDAIFCHNGEMLQGKYSPVAKSLDQFFKEYEDSYTQKELLKNVKPMTLEGCVVRVSDVIAYIGKDIEDAVRIGKLEYSQLPPEIVKGLGSSNSEIINTIILDIIENSFNKNYIKMSDKIFNLLQKLIDFNYKNIYSKANDKENIENFEKMFNELFELYCNQIKNNEVTEDIYVNFLNSMTLEYKNNNSTARIVIDYIAGMTDDYFQDQYRKYFG